MMNSTRETTCAVRLKFSHVTIEVQQVFNSTTASLAGKLNLMSTLLQNHECRKTEYFPQRLNLPISINSVIVLFVRL